MYKEIDYVVEAENVSFRYDYDYVLKNVSLAVPRGAFLAIVGPNGSGKSTFLKLLLQLLKLQEGKIKLFGHPIDQFKEREKIGYVSQKANSFNSGFPATVFEVVATGLTKRIGLFKFMSKADREKIIETIDSVGMSQFMNRNIGELSGGQQQRVFIARALVSDPELLILDEPTVGVDYENVVSFMNLLEYLNKEKNLTLIMVTHDFSSVSDKITHVARLNKQLYFFGTIEEYREKEERGNESGDLSDQLFPSSQEVEGVWQ